MCIVIREPAEGTETDVTAVRGQNRLRNAGRPQPSRSLPAVGDRLCLITRFPTAAGPIRGVPGAPTPISALLRAPMPRKAGAAVSPGHLSPLFAASRD